MNREAAALGIPVYSVFRGKLGAIDRRLNEEGKLVLVNDSRDVETKFAVRARKRNDGHLERPSSGVIGEILDHVDRIVEQEGV